MNNHEKLQEIVGFKHKKMSVWVFAIFIYLESIRSSLISSCVLSLSEATG